MIWDVLALIAITILFFISSIFNVLYYRKYRKLIVVIAQLAIDKEMIANKLDEQILLSSKEVNDGFVKFLSESREAAFDYIENVQKSIANYVEAIDSNDGDRILTARMELFSHLPDNLADENKDK